MQINKRGLCAFDDKRYLLDDGISTLAFGHRSIAALLERVDEPARHNDRVLACTTAARQRIPPSKRLFVPIGQDPGKCLQAARQVMASAGVGAPDGPPAISRPYPNFTRNDGFSTPQVPYWDCQPARHNQSAPAVLEPSLEDQLRFVLYDSD